MTNYAEDICRILHMAKVFPCLFPMGKTNNDNYTPTLVINFDKTANFYLFILGSYIPALQDQRHCNRKHPDKQFKTCVKRRWSRDQTI